MGDTRYVGDSYEVDSDGTTRRLIDAPGRRLAVITASSTTTTIQYLHPDALGSAHLSTDASGTPAFANDDFAYGLPRVSAPLSQPEGPTRTFTGKELDGSGLYYFGARYYQPEVARFTQIDPVSLSLTGPGLENIAGGVDLQTVLLNPWQYLHPYSYASDNPLRHVDDAGKFSVDWSGKEFSKWLAQVITDYAEQRARESVEHHAEEYAALSSEEKTIFGNDPERHAETMDIIEGVAFGSFGAVEQAGVKAAGQFTRTTLGKVGQIWKKAGNLTPVQNAFRHWKKHASEFPELKNALQYVQAAKEFLKRTGDKILSKVRSNGDMLKYDPTTNTFGVQDANGNPVTFFRPKEGIDYWNQQ